MYSKIYTLKRQFQSQPVLCDCSSLLSVAVNTNNDQKRLCIVVCSVFVQGAQAWVQGRGVPSYSYIIEESQCRSLGRSQSRNHRFLLAHSLWAWLRYFFFFNIAQAHLPRNVIPTVGQAFLHQLSIKKMPHRYAYWPI